MRDEEVLLLTPARHQPEPKRVLVVDDNVDAAASLRLLLELAGYEVHEAHDGDCAVEAATTFCPDVILMDIGMPRVSGLEATRRIRRLRYLRQPLIVATTAWGEALDRVASEEAGIDVHLVKPVEPDVLYRLLDSGEGRTEAPRSAFRPGMSL